MNLLPAMISIVLAAPVERVDRDRWLVTAYCPCPICCGSNARGITASGRPARGRIVAAPAGVPFGTRLSVPGYGLAVVLDRGGRIRGRRLDVLMRTHSEARAWGRRWVTVRNLRGR